MSETIIRVENVWKRYGLPFSAMLKQGRDFVRGQYDKDPTAYGPWALQDVSFEIKRGDAVGIVGRNGGGKSTLLKLLAGVTPVTRGKVTSRGRIFPMIELNAGMHRELTGRENIRLLGTLMGLSDAEIDRKIPLVEDFSELGKWLAEPIWKYSYGMLTRLGFSVAVNVNADILLIDEVLSVGDISFKKKCLSRMDQLVDEGVTMLFVSHSPYEVERICKRAIFLKNGALVGEGDASDIVKSYFDEVARTEGDPNAARVANSAQDLSWRPGTGDHRMLDISFHDATTGEKVESIQTEDPVIIRTRLQINKPVEYHVMNLRLHDSAGTVIASLQPNLSQRDLLPDSGEVTIDCLIESLSFLPGPYWVEFVSRETEQVLIDHVPYAANLNVKGTKEVFEQSENVGLVYVPAQWSVAETTN